MKISEVIDVLVAEKVFGRTPSGRSLTEYAIGTLRAALEDTKNIDQECIKCLNCQFITSSLLAPSGCPSCGSKDLTINITKQDIA